MEARRLVRECGRSGVVGREGKLLRERDAERARDGGAEVGVVEAMLRWTWCATVSMRLVAVNVLIALEGAKKVHGQARAPPSSTRQAVAGAGPPFRFQFTSCLLQTLSCSCDLLSCIVQMLLHVDTGVRSDDKRMMRNSSPKWNKVKVDMTSTY
jgi:hypothetical protein